MTSNRDVPIRCSCASTGRYVRSGRTPAAAQVQRAGWEGARRWLMGVVLGSRTASWEVMPGAGMGAATPLTGTLDTPEPPGVLAKASAVGVERPGQQISVPIGLR